MDYVINREKMNFADASSHERELNSGRDSDQDPRDSISGQRAAGSGQWAHGQVVSRAETENCTVGEKNYTGVEFWRRQRLPLTKNNTYV
jgi:hypothetical protein